ncbi:uncharacterized protein CEXT_450471 [Caerostris extrusa]|uniref:ABC-2 type transporter transmembrane domain-containing protein n=1 Tax=Caerostris extrusa TaxID=172846 RepID=A0AAV4NPM8_CAEEX|nr:uncharacterized protein CEXT_450471 [Caerostris extrusa]
MTNRDSVRKKSTIQESSENFVELVTNNRLKKLYVWMQKFPYPEYRDTSIGFSVINLVPWVLCYGYLIFIINIVRRVIEEKTNGSKELLKMMGMTDCTYWTSTFMNYFIIALITMFITTIIYKVPMKNAVVFLKHTNFVLLFIILSLFMASLILFCLAFSIFFNRPVLAIIALLQQRSFLVCYISLPSGTLMLCGHGNRVFQGHSISYLQGAIGVVLNETMAKR